MNLCTLSGHKKSEVLVNIFLQAFFLNWKSKVDKMDRAVESAMCKCKKFSYEEFLLGLGLMIGAAEFSQNGVDLFGGKKVKKKKMTSRNGVPSALIHTLSSSWLLAISKSQEGFCLLLLRKVKKKVIHGGDFLGQSLTLI